MGHIVLDVTILRVSERPSRVTGLVTQRRHVTFDTSERKTAYPVHAPDMHEDEGCDPSFDDGDLVTLRSSKTTSSCTSAEKKRQDPTATLEQEMSRDSRERAEGYLD